MDEDVQVLYKYTRMGVDYYTPNELIAQLRTDTGYYSVIESH